MLTLLLALQLAFASMAQASAAYGGSFGDAFKGSFINSVVALGFVDAQTGIGDVFANGANGGEGSLGHVLLHGLAGCAAAEAQGADCRSGAAGGIAGAVFSGLQTKPDTNDSAALAAWKADVIRRAEWVSLGVAWVASGGKAENVSAGNVVATGVVANNYLGRHDAEEYEAVLKGCETAPDFAACARQVWDSGFDDIFEANQQDLLACMSSGNEACVQSHLTVLRDADAASKRVSQIVKNHGFNLPYAQGNAYLTNAFHSHYGLAQDIAIAIQSQLCGGLSAADCGAVTRQIGEIRRADQDAAATLILAVAALPALALAPETLAVLTVNAVRACATTPGCVGTLAAIDLASAGIAVYDCASNPSVSSCAVAALGALPAGLDAGAKVLIRHSGGVSEATVVYRDGVRHLEVVPKRLQDLTSDQLSYQRLLDGIDELDVTTDRNQSVFYSG